MLRRPHAPIRVLFIAVNLLVTILSGISIAQDDDNPYLTDESNIYHHDLGHIQRLNGSVFDALVGNKPYAWLIQFYSNWCGDCIAYSPRFKRISVSVSGWQTIVRLGVVDAADFLNQHLTARLNISRYPTFLWFDPSYRFNDIVQPQRVDKPFTEESLRTAILHQLEAVDFPPKEWGDFSIRHLKKGTSLGTISTLREGQPVYLVVENEFSMVGQQLYMDVFEHKNITLRMALNTDEKLLNEMRLRKLNFNHVYLVELKPRSARLLASSEGTVEPIHVMLRKLGIYKHPTPPESDLRRRLAPLKTKYGSLYQTDLNNGVIRAVRQEIFGRSELTKDQINVAVSTLEGVVAYTPISDDLKQKATKLANALKSKSELKGDLQKFLDDIGWPKKLKKFQECRGTMPGTREYSCALWSLLHALTVGAYEAHVKGQLKDPKVALLIIRGYVGTFFSCAWCRRHFLGMAEKIDAEVKTPEDTPMWLWQAHNRANKRLSGGNTDDPARPKQQFPPKSICGPCHNPRSTPQEPDWNKAEVLKFLRKFYSPEHVETKDID